MSTKFVAPGRQLFNENYLKLTSVGVDIGSSTSHMVFSRLELERQGTRYVTVERSLLYESDILLTPYQDATTIDQGALGRFIAAQYSTAGLKREEVDTGALILTGLALRKENARAIADIFAEEAGRFVSISAGDNLEATLAAHGSEAVALSDRDAKTILNLDIGGGTTKLALCSRGRILSVAALDIGARLIILDDNGVIVRLEETGRQIGAAAGVDLKVGRQVEETELGKVAEYMAQHLFELTGLAPLSIDGQELLRTQPLTHDGPVDGITFSGGVAEFIYQREDRPFGDLGGLLAKAVNARAAQLGIKVWQQSTGIRATVIGASQYTVQVSGNTIYVSPLEVLPARNIPVVNPNLGLQDDAIEEASIREQVVASLDRLDLLEAEGPVALAFRWDGSASYRRLDSLCRGIAGALEDNLSRGNPLVLMCDGDVGGLLGIHLKEEMKLTHPVISIDGVDLREFDYVDIGEYIPTSGAVPVVIKSLVFPGGRRI